MGRCKMGRMCDELSADDQSKQMTDTGRLRKDIDKVLRRVDSLATIDSRSAERYWVTTKTGFLISPGSLG